MASGNSSGRHLPRRTQRRQRWIVRRGSQRCSGGRSRWPARSSGRPPRGRTRRARRWAAGRHGCQGRRSGGMPRTALRARTASARAGARSGRPRSRPPRAGPSSPRASRSGRLRASRRRSSRGLAWIVAMLPAPPHWATSRPPGRRTAARFRNRASWSGTQWNVAVDRMASASAPPGSRNGLPEVGDEVGDPLAEPVEPATGLLDHRGRAVERRRRGRAAGAWRGAR